MSELMQDQDWYTDAACAEIGGDEWFPEKGGSTREAKTVCNGDGTDARPACPVREQCLAWAMANDERFGIYGGTSERERRRLKKDGWTPPLAATGTDASVPIPAAAVSVDDWPAPPRQYGLPYVGGANGDTHYPLPNPDRVVHIEPRANAKSSIDWDEIRRRHDERRRAEGTLDDQPAVTVVQLRCRWCRQVADELTNDLCPSCVADAEAKFAGPTSVPSLAEEHRADHDDTPPAEESPTPATTSQTEQDTDPMADYPDYIRQMADIMAETEGHPDPDVKTARKVVANAFVALNKTLQASPVTEGQRNAAVLDRELAAVEKRGAKRGGARPRTATVRRHAGDGVKAVSARLKDLGVTAAQIRRWATDQGLDVPTRGAVPGRIVDAWIQAHRAVAS